MKLSVLILLGVTLTSCNLAIDSDAYPYEPITQIGISAPEIIFTEILPWSSITAGVSTDERGEFIEIKNVGNVAIDPEDIFIEIRDSQDGDPIQTIEVIKPRSQAALEATEALRPIEPGSYFVFIRYQTERSPLTIDASKFYDYGEFGEKIELDQSEERFLSLSYREENRIVVSDQLSWETNQFRANRSGALEMEVDRSIVLDQSKENNEDNNEVSNWCLEKNFAQLGGINATPGKHSDCEKVE